MNSLLKNINFEGDKTIWSVVFILSIFSILVVYSAAGWGALFNHLSKIMIGLFAMYVVHKIKFKYFSRLGMMSYYASLVLLVLVFIVGVSVNGASRWLSIAGQQFQPSDIAKLSVILFMARQLSKYRDHINELKDVIWHAVFPLVVVCLLILPNNFSTAAMVFLNGLVLMFIAKVRIKYIVLIIGSAFVVSATIYATAKHTPLGTKIIPRSATWVSRIDSFFSSDENEQLNEDFQVTQALVAIHNGGLMGVGPGKSTQRRILPYSYSDFVFAIMVEEYGLIFGAFFPLLLYLILFFRSIRIALKTESFFAAIISIGLIFSLIFQALINMCVAVDIIPVTGQPLPLISMGGTSILFTCITIGIVLSVSRDSTDRDYEKA